MTPVTTTGTISGIARRDGMLFFDLTEDGTGEFRSFYATGTEAHTDVRDGQEHTTVHWDADEARDGTRYHALGIYLSGWPQP